MRITKLTATNFKGWTGSDELGTVTIFTGRNAACKSARIEALALAVTGYVPGDKPVRSNRDIFDLYGSGNPVSVGFDVEVGRSVLRTYQETGGSVKYTGPESTTLPSIGWDPSEYLGLSGPKALAFICRATAGGGFNRVEELDRLCADVKNLKLEKNTPASERAIQSAVSGLRSCQAPTGSLAEWVGALVEDCAGRKTLADQSLKRSRQTVQGLAQAASSVLPDLSADAKYEQASAIERAARTELDKATALLEDARRQYANARPTNGETLDQIRAKIEVLRQAVTGPAPVRPTKQEDDEVVKAGEERYSAKSAHDAKEREIGELIATNEEISSRHECTACHRPLPKAARIAALAAMDSQIQQAKLDVVKLRKATEKATNRHLELASALIKRREAAVARSKSENDLAIAIAQEKDAALLPALKETGTRLAEQVRIKQATLDEAAKVVLLARGARAVLGTHRTEEQTRAKVLEQAEQAEADAQVAKGVLAIVTDRQERAVKDAVQPLVDRVNDLAGSLLPSPARYIDGEIRLAGWTHRTASDSEKLALYGGICFAFASTAQIRVAVIGRFESFDNIGKMKLIETATRLVNEGKLDQLVVVHVAQQEGSSELSEVSKIEGVKIIICNKKESK